MGAEGWTLLHIQAKYFTEHPLSPEIYSYCRHSAWILIFTSHHCILKRKFNKPDSFYSLLLACLQVSFYSGFPSLLPSTQLLSWVYSADSFLNYLLFLDLCSTLNVLLLCINKALLLLIKKIFLYNPCLSVKNALFLYCWAFLFSVSMISLPSISAYKIRIDTKLNCCTE